MSFGRLRLLVVKVKTNFFPVSCKSFFNFYFFPTGMPPRTSYHREQIPKTRVAE